MKDGNVLVTIRCLAYNHEAYIHQCLEGFVMQKTNFRFEAIVHDDASTDSTAVIIREYANKYPDIIKPIFETENQYSKHDGSLRRIMNTHIRGKYVAICEGDDYWTDPLKLQKQVDFMESHSDYSLCFHATNCIYAHSNFSYIIIKKERADFSIEDLILGGGGFMATNSMFYKAEFVKEAPSWMLEAPVGDLPLMLLLGTKGKVRYIDEIMSVYRVSSGGWTSTVGKDVRKIKKYYYRLYVMFDDFDRWSDLKYHKWVVMYKRVLNKNRRKEILMCYLKRLLGDEFYYKLHKIYLGLKPCY